MLSRLQINNLAVIENAIFEPKNGFNVISGETGAGKSLLIDAISLIMGIKASRDMVRAGADEAVVEALFDISDIEDSGLRELLDSNGIDYSDGILIILRKVTGDGRSSARINGRTVIMSALRSISAYLVDIHGQHDTQQIFDSSFHLSMLDAFSGEEVANLLEQYRKILAEYKAVVLEIRRLTDQPESAGARIDYLSKAIEEINDAAFKEGEEEELVRIRKQGRRTEQKAALIGQAEALINSEDGSGMDVMARIDSAARYLIKAGEMDDEDKTAVELSDRLTSLLSMTADISGRLSNYLAASRHDPQAVAAADARYSLLMDLEGKYNCSSIKELNDFAIESREEIGQIQDGKARLAVLRKQRSSVEKALLDKAEELSDARKAKADMLSQAITENLRDLEIPSASFYVEFRRRERERFFTSGGIDDVTFMFSANPGQPPRNLAQTASGGEASRIMLAIKNILSAADTVPTLIFDEIDTGVSGRSSIAISRKLKSISTHHQVLCVTHTSQLAAAADSNFLITKQSGEDNSYTVIRELDYDEKVSEVSRLLSGTNDEESILLAKQMISSMA